MGYIAILEEVCYNCDISHKGDYYAFNFHGMFFGHRRIDDTKTIETRVKKVIDTILLQHEYVEFLVGRNGEFDQIVSSAVLRSKKRADAGNCSLTWVMPYLSSDYTHNQEDYERYYDAIEVCEQSALAHPKSAIQIRNRAIVDRSDLCVFYVCKNTGGAFQTMRYAAKEGKNIINLSFISHMSV